MKKKFSPASLMMSHGYEPSTAHGAIKSPIYQTSTFEFETAEEGKAFFELAYGKRSPEKGEETGYIYSRINNPNLDITERRLALLEHGEQAALFSSGMAATATTFLAFLKPGDILLCSQPVYGGTDHLIHHSIKAFGIESYGFDSAEELNAMLEDLHQKGQVGRVKMIFMETPANPTNNLIDIQACKNIARSFSSKDQEIILAVDNTFLGPMWQKPLEHGADLVLYSATKFIGGHSDLIAGVCIGTADLMAQVKEWRSFLGTMATPYTAWLIMRSLETLQIRMERQQQNARQIAAFLEGHPKVEKIHYLGLEATLDPATKRIFNKQCNGPGSIISFDIVGGEKEAFQFLNHLQLIKLAVSLGGTESLAQHPDTMTHAGVDPQLKTDLGITGKLVRLSIGIEQIEDLLADIEYALTAVKTNASTSPTKAKAFMEEYLEVRS